MPRYFLELSYKGEGYSGFQVQQNAITIQEEVEKAFRIFFKKDVELTGSSRTDAGVHALQNYFHFDWDDGFPQASVYNLNAILPAAIVIKSVKEVKPDAHSRFHATAREYKYFIYDKKNPFIDDRAWYLPYTLDEALLDACAQKVKNNLDFSAFSKRNTQVKTFQCSISVSEWISEDGCLVYHVQANRFLRGMVRGLVGTMVRVARGTMSLDAFEALLAQRTLASADFSAPAKGLFLVGVSYPEAIFL
ncbi:tRNA pseudouridine(38-40) synthase TruA [Lacibacter sediminis]|uniref:tRNA pseudouridine synthase A n=1 Tax=Lacibacter sediminis TaxID=2760713 RepID=A0A7G5XIN4_9BACT|nr:tRNA pseudouridine(38-40) synthase TruA [Lacibacter sediminis]QNA45337.1 tRNA pseudouridine(38-40) synthase TruA [Lacibacter sediminis]